MIWHPIGQIEPSLSGVEVTSSLARGAERPQAAAAVSRRSRASAEVMGRSRPAHLMTNPSTSAGSSAVNACTIWASDPDAIGSLSCEASSFSSASRISLAGMFNMVFNTLTISEPPVDRRRGTRRALRPDGMGPFALALQWHATNCAPARVACDPRRAIGKMLILHPDRNLHIRHLFAAIAPTVDPVCFGLT
jgi:hypothetical protein